MEFLVFKISSPIKKTQKPSPVFITCTAQACQCASTHKHSGRSGSESRGGGQGWQGAGHGQRSAPRPEGSASGAAHRAHAGGARQGAARGCRQRAGGANRAARRGSLALRTAWLHGTEHLQSAGFVRVGSAPQGAARSPRAAPSPRPARLQRVLLSLKKGLGWVGFFLV